MKSRIIDLGMHPFADTFIEEKQLSLSEPVYSLQCLLDKDTSEISLGIDTKADERYNLYIQRKDYILKNLSNELQILSSKIRFINDVIEEKISIYKKKKEEIIQSLIDRQYKQIKDKIMTDKFEEKNTTGYDYLIKMSLYSFTEEEIEKLKKEHDKIYNEYQDLNEKTIEDLWASECSQFMKQYRRMKLNSEK